MKKNIDTMKSMIITGYGGTDVFKSFEMPKPAPKGKEVLVRVLATSVNPIDYKIRKGVRSTGVTPPQILGFDVCGIVEEIGDKVTDFKCGDEVYYLPRIIGWQGAYAEYHLVEESIVARKPKNLSYVEAASIPLACCTAWDALIERIKVRIGDSVLIHAGAGGVGSLAIQLAKLSGAYVFATCSSKNKDMVSKLGADCVIDYKNEDFVQVILKETNNEGVNAVFDTVGEAVFTKSLDAIKPFGRIASIVKIPANLEKALFKNIDIHPVFVQSGRYKLDALRELIERKQLKPVIDSIMPLKDVVKAHEKIEAGGVRGKIVLEVTK